MNSYQSYQFECYSLESPISCTALSFHHCPKKIHQQNQQNPIQPNICAQKLQVTLWDHQNKMENYIMESLDQRTLSPKDTETRKIQKGEVKSHKFGIKKAYTCGSYLIILDEDKIVTVRKQWQILQCFTDVQDIVFYQQSSTINFLVQKEKQQKDNFNNEFYINSFQNVSIFILNQVKQSINESTQSPFLKSELIFLSISNSQVETVQDIKGLHPAVLHKSIKLRKNASDKNQSQILKLGSNGQWGYTQNYLFSIQIKQASLKLNLDETMIIDQSLKIQTKCINLNKVGQKIGIDFEEILLLKRLVNENFLIIFLSKKGILMNCEFKEAFKNESVQVINFTKIYNPNFYLGQQISQKIGFLFWTSKSKQNSSLEQIQKYTNLMVRINGRLLQIYDVHSLNLIHQLDLCSILNLQFSSKSTIVFNQGSNLWIFDKSNMSLHKINVRYILNSHVLKPMVELFNPECEQLVKSHSNTVKLLNLRLKVLKLLQAYLRGKINENSPSFMQQSHTKNSDYSSCLRLLNKEENISILNDGITFVVKWIINQNEDVKSLQGKLSSVLTLKDFQQSLIKVIGKLILSKYESHVENGLDLLLKILSFFNPRQQLNSSTCKSLYIKIIQSSRIQKLLQQQKKKKLWELAYMLSVKSQTLGQKRL